MTKLVRINERVEKMAVKTNEDVLVDQDFAEALRVYTDGVRKNCLEYFEALSEEEDVDLANALADAGVKDFFYPFIDALCALKDPMLLDGDRELRWVKVEGKA